MNSKQPKLMDLSRMRDIITPHLAQISKNVFFNNELAVVHGDHSVFRLLMRHKPPFSINDHRFGIILSGEAHINFNLHKEHISSKTSSKIYTFINKFMITRDSITSVSKWCSYSIFLQ